MPELPEVESVVRSLTPIIGKTIHQITTSNKKFRIDAVTNFKQLILNQHIHSIRRRSKYIIIDIEGDHYLIFHLGMSGRILFGKNLKPTLHDHLSIIFKDGENLIFNDPRRFGLYTLIKKSELESHTLFKNLGIEPLTNNFSYSSLTKILKKRRSPIKSVLMDAKAIVGVGNIYASESLFKAKILPYRKADSLSSIEIKRLCDAIKQVLQEAIAAGGSTLKDYVISTGDAGYFQHKFQVYSRNGKPCYSCKSAIQNEKIAGRSSYFCPKCQF